MINLTAPETLNYIISIVTKHDYKKVVLQFNKKLLPQSFELTAQLRRLCPNNA